MQLVEEYGLPTGQAQYIEKVLADTAREQQQLHAQSMTGVVAPPAANPGGQVIFEAQQQEPSSGGATDSAADAVAAARTRMMPKQGRRVKRNEVADAAPPCGRCLFSHGTPVAKPNAWGDACVGEEARGTLAFEGPLKIGV